jgi:solute carrier family 50 protein (sugar transporter)
MPLLLDFASTLGTISSIAVFASPLTHPPPPPPLTLFATLANCIVWSAYGSLANSTPISVTNVLGFALTFLAIMRNLPNMSSDTKVKGLIAEGGVLIGAVGFAVGVMPGDMTALGFICSSMSVAMFASPLAAVRRVIRSRSTEGMSFAFAVTSVVCTASWVVVGLGARDAFIWVPNGLALLLSLIQLILFYAYPNGPRRYKASRMHFSV